MFIHCVFIIIKAKPSKWNVNGGARDQAPNQEPALAFPVLALVFLELI